MTPSEYSNVLHKTEFAERFGLDVSRIAYITGDGPHPCATCWRYPTDEEAQYLALAGYKVYGKATPASFICVPPTLPDTLWTAPMLFQGDSRLWSFSPHWVGTLTGESRTLIWQGDLLDAMELAETFRANLT